ncbi:MAG: hypothetical protein IT383_01205 [Deltaproteobacteria bacterium]|nr:hypothetical protein [Deltaproteobacteria bacterium]
MLIGSARLALLDLRSLLEHRLDRAAHGDDDVTANDVCQGHGRTNDDIEQRSRVRQPRQSIACDADDIGTCHHIARSCRGERCDIVERDDDGAACDGFADEGGNEAEAIELQIEIARITHQAQTVARVCAREVKGHVGA